MVSDENFCNSIASLVWGSGLDIKVGAFKPETLLVDRPELIFRFIMQPMLAILWLKDILITLNLAYVKYVSYLKKGI